MIGYIGINVFRLESSAVNIIRMISAIPMALLISIKIDSYSIARPALIFLSISALGVSGSSISLNVIYIILFVSAFRSIPFPTLTKLSSQALGLAVVVSLAFSVLGITENSVDVSSSFLEDSEDHRVRFTFGYRNVNALTALISAFCMLVMLRGKQKIARYIFSGAISYIFYIYTDSRTLIASVALFAIFSIYFNLLKTRRKMLIGSTVLISIIPLAYSIFSSEILNYMPLLDLILSKRLSLGSSYLEGLSPLEKVIGGAAPVGDLTIDNAILLVIGAVGLPATFYLFIKVTQALKECIVNNDHRLYAFLLSFWLLSVTESSLVRPESIICLPFWIAVIFKSRIRGQYANTAA